LTQLHSAASGWIATENYGNLRETDHAQHPAGRVGTPNDIAEIVAWLLDADRSDFVTGANFMVDGGMTHEMIYEE
jgi:NAD(P)-dependent dehydrogenase (short-subunit alcohol dehydrogenase family)